MKYIRVIEDSEEYITTRENLHDHILALQDSGFDFEGGIIKEADTIEELCDEFVFVDADKEEDKHGIVGKVFYNHFKEEIKKAIHKHTINGNIFGAIWTDKGLIYKAIMKGILPNGEIDWELL